MSIPHVTLTDPNTNHSIDLSPRETTLIFDALSNIRPFRRTDDPETIALSIRLGDFLDSIGFPTAD